MNSRLKNGNHKSLKPFFIQTKSVSDFFHRLLKFLRKKNEALKCTCVLLSLNIPSFDFLYANIECRWI